MGRKWYCSPLHILATLWETLSLVSTVIMAAGSCCPGLEGGTVGTLYSPWFLYIFTMVFDGKKMVFPFLKKYIPLIIFDGILMVYKPWFSRGTGAPLIGSLVRQPSIWLMPWMARVSSGNLHLRTGFSMIFLCDELLMSSDSRGFQGFQGFQEAVARENWWTYELHPMRGSVKLRPLIIFRDGSMIHHHWAAEFGKHWTFLSHEWTSEMLQEDSFIGALDEFTKD